MAMPMVVPRLSAIKSLMETVRGGKNCCINSMPTAVAKQKALVLIIAIRRVSGCLIALLAATPKNAKGM